MAVSAAAVGCDVHAADLFADVDLSAVTATSRRIHAYPDGLAEAAALFPPAPWCYTGAIENHPGFIERLAAARPLAGNPAATVRRVRDPALLAEALAAERLAFPETFATAEGVPRDGSFVRKPRHGAGGRGIVAWTAGAAAGAGAADEDHVWQRWIEGMPLAAAFVMERGTARLLGISRQLLGAPWCQAREHAYCGSVELPRATLPAGALDQLVRLGDLLAAAFGLVGVVGTDCVLGPDGTITLIEVNPRPTASMELAERSAGISIAGEHLAACGSSPAPPPHPAPSGGRWAKAVLFAACDVAVDHALLDRTAAKASAWTAADGGWPAVADIPQPDQTIPSGRPVLTVFARAATAGAARALLERRTRCVAGLIATPPCGGRPAARPAAPEARTASDTRLRWCPDRSP